MVKNHRDIGVGALIKKELRAGKDNCEILKIVIKEIPHSRTTSGTINYYRCGLRSEGEYIKTSRGIKKARRLAALEK
jgi:hypothetical protein